MRRNCRARLRILPQIPVYQSSSLPPEACRSVDDVVVEFQRLICLSPEFKTEGHRGMPFDDCCGSYQRASGRMIGSVYVTPLGLGFGVRVTIACGVPANPFRSWMRISRAKSSCTVLWQWLT